MKKMLLIGLGGAVGYTLGAKAGRPAYDRIMTGWSQAVHSLGLGRLATTVKEAGIDVRDSAVDRVSTAVSTKADDVTERMDADTGTLPGSSSNSSDVAGWDRPLTTSGSPLV